MKKLQKIFGGIITFVVPFFAATINVSAATTTSSTSSSSSDVFISLLYICCLSLLCLFYLASLVFTILMIVDAGKRDESV